MTKSVSLSTMSARGNYGDLLDFSRDAQAWGYAAVEANAYVTTPAMLARLAGGPLPISSLHNPIPNGRSPFGMSAYDLNSALLMKRSAWRPFDSPGKRLSDAARLHARAIILHMGHVPIPERRNGVSMTCGTRARWGRRNMWTYRSASRKCGPEARRTTLSAHLRRARTGGSRTRARRAPRHRDETQPS